MARDKDRLQEIRERAEKASKGPWRVRAEGGFSPSMSVWDDKPWKIAHLGKTLDGPNGENADFIAHAREDIPYLLDRVGELERITAQQRERMRTYLLERDAARGRVGEQERENQQMRRVVSLARNICLSGGLMMVDGDQARRFEALSQSLGALDATQT